MGEEDPDRGTVVGAAVVLEPGESSSAQALRGSLRPVLSAYKIPRWIAIVEKDDLPLTRTGKVHKDRLKALIEAGVAQ